MHFVFKKHGVVFYVKRFDRFISLLFLMFVSFPSTLVTKKNKFMENVKNMA